MSQAERLSIASRAVEALERRHCCVPALDGQRDPREAFFPPLSGVRCRPFRATPVIVAAPVGWAR